MLDVWPDLQAKRVRRIGTSELFLKNVFNSLLTQCTTSIRRHLGFWGFFLKQNKNFFKIWFPYSIVFQSPKILQVLPMFSCLTLLDKEISYSKLLFCLCLVLNRNDLWLTKIPWRLKYCRCLLIRHNPNPFKTSKSCTVQPQKIKLIYLVSTPHSFSCQPVLAAQCKP